MKRSTLMSAIGASTLLAMAMAPAMAVVTDDLEAYTIGDDANVANAAVFTDVGGNPIGTIEAGTATTNVASSNVLSHTSGGGIFTRLNGSDITGNFTLTYDFFANSTTEHNTYLRDATNGIEGVLIRVLNGTATQHFIQVRGAGGGVVFEALVDYGDWYRATVNFQLNANPALSTFDISFHNLTDNTAVTGHVDTGSGATIDPLSFINQIQIESASGGVFELDNFTVPEPGSLGLIGLGCAALFARRRK